MNNRSSQAQQMFHQQYGFRTDAESVQTIGEFKNQAILNYEMNELDNEDIPDTLNQLYNTNFQPNQDDQYDAQAIDQFIKHQLNTKTYYLIWLVSEWQQCFELYAPQSY